MNRELTVTPDIAAVTSEIFLKLRPRTIALSGGSTPRPVYESLARLNYDWSVVDVFFGDERCVPPDHPDSNYRMAYESLLSKVPARVHRMPGEACDSVAYELELRSVISGEPPAFDLIFLGIGEDGHTASLFPGAPSLDEAQRLVLSVPGPDHRRLTFTLPLINAAKVALLMISGVGKREALRKMLAGEDIPVSRVASGRVIVVADPDAAGL